MVKAVNKLKLYNLMGRIKKTICAVQRKSFLKFFSKNNMIKY